MRRPPSQQLCGFRAPGGSGSARKQRTSRRLAVPTPFAAVACRVAADAAHIACSFLSATPSLATTSPPTALQRMASAQTKREKGGSVPASCISEPSSCYENLHYSFFPHTHQFLYGHEHRSEAVPATLLIRAASLTEKRCVDPTLLVAPAFLAKGMVYGEREGSSVEWATFTLSGLEVKLAAISRPVPLYRSTVIEGRRGRAELTRNEATSTLLPSTRCPWPEASRPRCRAATTAALGAPTPVVAVGFLFYAGEATRLAGEEVSIWKPKPGMGFGGGFVSDGWWKQALAYCPHIFFPAPSKSIQCVTGDIRTLKTLCSIHPALLLTVTPLNAPPAASTIHDPRVGRIRLYFDPSHLCSGPRAPTLSAPVSLCLPLLPHGTHTPRQLPSPELSAPPTRKEGRTPAPMPTKTLHISIYMPCSIIERREDQALQVIRCHRGASAPGEPSMVLSTS
jgi:hypothetical protein